MRLTCTSIGERKILICCHVPGGAAVATAGPATSTRPSAGARTTSTPAGGMRSGSRKKNANIAASAPKAMTGIHVPAAADTTARPSAPAMNGRPAESRRTADPDATGGPRAHPCVCVLLLLLLLIAAAPDDVFHPIFELKLAFLEVGFFDLLGLGEICFGGQLLQAIFQLVMLDGELVKLLVRLDQLRLQILRLGIHAPPPWTSINRGTRERSRGPCGCIDCAITGANVAQGPGAFKASRTSLSFPVHLSLFRDSRQSTSASSIGLV